MQIALRDISETGSRTGRILLGDRRLDVLGLLDHRPNDTSEPRLRRVSDLESYGVLVSDAVDDLEDDITTALDAGISCVTWSDAPDLSEKYGESFAAAGRTLLTGANVGHGIAPCLAAHEAARSDEVLELMVAWTEPGRRLRRGVPVAFPDPIGALWGYEVATSGLSRAVTAPTGGIWSGAATKVTASTGDGLVVRVVGVADLAVHLEALALAAGALTVDSFAYGAARPDDRAEDYLEAALGAGLDVAAHTLER